MAERAVILRMKMSVERGILVIVYSLQLPSTRQIQSGLQGHNIGHSLACSQKIHDPPPKEETHTLGTSGVCPDLVLSSYVVIVVVVL